MRDGRCAPLFREMREPLCLQATFCADAERIRLATKHVARDQVLDHRVEEVLFAVDQDMLDRAQRERAFLQQ